jgi:hypothetical protein
VKDKAGRVLGGGVSNRYEGRLKVVSTFFESRNDQTLGRIKKSVLSVAGVKESDVKKEVDRLVKESARFVGINIQKKSKIVVT